MTATSSTDASTDRGLGPMLAVAGLVLVILLTVVAGRGGPNDTGIDLDPRSTGPAGTRALLDTMRVLGADVVISSRLPSDRTDTVLLLRDDLDEDRANAVQAWVRGGGVLLVADPSSDFAPDVGRRGIGPAVRTCGPEIHGGAFDDVDRLQTATTLAFVPTGTHVSCFGSAVAAVVTVRVSGRGAIVSLADPSMLRNDRLGIADHLRLAVSVLAPTTDTSVQVLTAAGLGSGATPLRELVDDRIVAAAWWLLACVGLVALGRGRRFGAPVDEVLPVRVRGSDLTRSAGELWQRTDGRAQAAEALRDATRHAMVARGLRPDPASAAAIGVEAVTLGRVLATTPPADDEELRHVAAACRAVRRALDRTEHPPGLAPGSQTAPAPDVGSPATPAPEDRP